MVLRDFLVGSVVTALTLLALDWWMSPDSARRILTRTIAKEAKRPFVRVWIGWQGNVVPGEFSICKATLIVPKRKYLSPIITPLLLAPERQSSWGHGLGDAPISRWSNTNDHYFYFTDVKLWQDYAHYMATDADVRKALKLPPLTSGGNDERAPREPRAGH